MKCLKILFSIVFIVLLYSNRTIAQDIFETINNGDFEAVKELLEKTPELIKTRDNEGDSPLTWAVTTDNIKIARYLIKQGAEINSSNKDGRTPLHWAAIRATKDMAELLIENGADINSLDYDKHTPLHNAGTRGNVEVAKLLVEKGVDLEIKDDYGRTPLILTARERGNIDIIRILIDSGANIDERDKFNDSSLDLAAWRGYRDVVSLLIDHGARINITGENGKLLLINAVSNGLDNLFSKLMEKEADLKIKDSRGGNLLHAASQGGSEKIVETLINKDLNLNQSDIFGWTPLHYASEKGHSNVVKILLEKGADIHARNIKGESAYNISAKNERQEIIVLLVQKGANQDPVKFPPLKGNYFGQIKQKEGPELFASGIVADKMGSHSPIVFSPDNKEAFWPSSVEIPGTGYTRGIILFSKQVNGNWILPEVAKFSSDYGDGEPFFSIDGSRLYFISRRPFSDEGRAIDENIWYIERQNKGWSDPKPFSEIINNWEMHWQFSLDKNNNVYFGSGAGGGMGMGDIYCSKYINGEYTTPGNLGANVNSKNGEFSPLIAPDSSFLIFTRNNMEKQKIGLFISFKKKDGTWTLAKDMGNIINGSGRSICSTLSPDGKYLFYLGNENGMSGIFWIQVDQIIEEHRKEELK
ncbi:MAG: ankyrin repeat domain-containing protein [Bacteroidales bacterium]|nr:ankyrin repeat domain-containing protein [Bacteroidales bacterium]